MISIFVKCVACGVIVAILGAELWSYDWWGLIICLNIVAHDLN